MLPEVEAKVKEALAERAKRRRELFKPPEQKQNERLDAFVTAFNNLVESFDTTVKRINTQDKQIADLQSRVAKLEDKLDHLEKIAKFERGA